MVILTYTKSLSLHNKIELFIDASWSLYEDSWSLYSFVRHVKVLLQKVQRNQK